MDRNLASVLVSVILLAGLAACQPDLTSPDSSPAPPTPTSAIPAAEHTFPLGCQPDRILLDNLKAQLPYPQNEILYQSYGGEHLLVVWLVDPALGTGTSTKTRSAAETAVHAAEILDSASVCVAKFDLLHITVVDDGYLQWFSGALRPEDLSDPGLAASGGGPQGERGAGLSSGSTTSAGTPGAGDCDFLSVRQALSQVFEAHDLDAGVYYAGDASGRELFLHWALPADQIAEDSLSLLEELLPEISCLYPRPSGLSITVAGPDGVVLLSGYLPAEIRRSRVDFDLAQLSYQLLEAP